MRGIQAFILSILLMVTCTVGLVGQKAMPPRFFDYLVLAVLAWLIVGEVDA